MKDNIVKRYSVPSYAEQYARRNFRWTNLTGLYKRREWKIIVRGFLKNCAGKDILDVGCGEGSYSIELAKQNHVIAIDRSKPLLSLVARRAPAVASLRMFNMDARNIAFEDGKFDVALCVDLLHHYPNDQCLAILREIRRVLKPRSGELITEFKNVENPFMRRSYRRWMREQFPKGGFYVQARSHGDFAALLSRAGFAVQDSRAILSPIRRLAPAIVLKCSVSGTQPRSGRRDSTLPTADRAASGAE